MELREIKYLLCIYRHKGITKAAEELYITQPALSKFLKNMETRIGGPLFSRMGNELLPTYLGERIISYALKLERLQNDCEMECADLLGEQVGSLSVAVPFMRGSCLLPTVLKRFYGEYPRVQVTLMEETRMLESYMLSDKGVHLLLGNDQYSKSHLVYHELGREEVLLAAPRDHFLKDSAVERPGCRYPWVDLSLAAHEKFLLHPQDQTTGRIALGVLQKAGITDPDILMHTRNSSLAYRMAAEGMGLAFIPESYAMHINLPEPPALYSVGNPKTETKLYIAYQKGRYLPTYATRFIQLLREEMAAMECFQIKADF